MEYLFEEQRPQIFTPEARFEILFQGESAFLTSTDPTTGWQPRPVGFVGGLHTSSYYVLPQERNSICYGLRLRPQAASALFKQELLDYRNGIVSVEDAFGESGRNLTEQLAAESSISEKCKLLVSFFESRLHPMKSRLPDDLEQLIKNNTSIPVSKLATRANTSVSNLRKLFAREIGLSPKEFIRVIRVRKSIEMIKQRNDLNLTQIGHTLGYFDQSHFVKEFKSVTGSSPGRYLSTASN